MIDRPPLRRVALTVALQAALTLGALSAGGCSLPGRAQTPEPRTFVLSDSGAAAARPGFDRSDCPTLRISPPRAAPGFATRRMVYAESPSELKYFAWHLWSDTPAQMLAVLIEQRLDAQGPFASVLSGAPDVAADLRLDVEQLKVLQWIGTGGSEVRLSAKLRLVDLRDRRVLGDRMVEVSAPAREASPTAGVAAAQRGTSGFLDAVANFAAGAAGSECGG